MNAQSFLAIFAAVFFLIIAAMVSAFLKERKKRAQRNEELQKLSFKALEKPAPEVVELLAALHRNEHRKDLRPRDIHEKRGDGYTVFLYDMMDYTGEGIDTVVTGGVAIHSERLSLPPFTVMCRIEGPGALISLAKQAMDKIIALAGTPMDFSSCPAFQEKYYVLGKDEKAIRAFLREPLLELLAEKSWRTLEARGQAFAYNRRDSYDYQKKQKVEVNTRENLQEALELFRAFTEKDEP